MLYGCETWSLTLREESGLRVFENRILRLIFGSKRDANGEWKRLHIEELNSSYSSPNIVRVIKSRRLIWAGHVARMEEGGCSFKTGHLQKRDLEGGIGVDGMIILEWIFKK